MFQATRSFKAVFFPFFKNELINFRETFVLSCFREVRKIICFFKTSDLEHQRNVQSM